MSAERDAEVGDLFALAFGSSSSPNAWGNMSISIYDTAWISCVSKDGQYCFPSSFQVILDAQQPDGLWPSRGPLSSDILNSLGGLFALLEHAKRDGDDGTLRSRIEKAHQALKEVLQTWRLTGSGGVAFEILMPTMLELVHRAGCPIDFPKRQELDAVKQAKLSLFSPEKLYTKAHALLHSAEAFYGDESFDYDLLRPHKVGNSLLGSPSATAAYLMRCTNWDFEAESYIREVVENGAGKGSGGVPSAFPSSYFEITWSTTTLLTSGFDFEHLAEVTKNALRSFLDESKASSGHSVGFAPGAIPDLDDTAKMSLLLNLVGRAGISERLIEDFEVETHFQTYPFERNPSFSANCNALHAIASDTLSRPTLMETTMPRMEKIASFLCRQWWDCGAFPGDKWNLSPYYPALLMVQSFNEFDKVLSQANDSQLTRSDMRSDMQLALTQCANRLISSQAIDGSWGNIGATEETAYVVLALASLSGISFPEAFDEALSAAIDSGKAFLQAQEHKNRDHERLWIEKVSYRSALISRSYVLSALQCRPLAKNAEYLPGTNYKSSKQLKLLDGLLKRLPAIEGCPSWRYKISQQEAMGYLEKLRSQRDQIFKRQGFSDDKYFEWIPHIWTLANNHVESYRSSKFLFNMMMISFINFQVDEYMESVVASLSEERLVEVEAYVKVTLKPVHHGNGVKHETNGSLENANGFHNEDVDAIFATLRRYVDFVLDHPDAQGAGAHDKALLREEICNFLCGHIDQIRLNWALKQQGAEGSLPARLTAPPRSFQSWVRGTASDHTSCPYSFVLACCWSSAGGKDFFPDLQQQYMASDLCHHLATMCRLYNDHGSLARDATEMNVNSANFPEMWTSISRAGEQVTAQLKDRIWQVAAYERLMLKASQSALEAVCSFDAAAFLRVFITVTDMFGQIYVVRDLASRRT